MNRVCVGYVMIANVGYICGSCLDLFSRAFGFSELVSVMEVMEVHAVEVTDHVGGFGCGCCGGIDVIVIYAGSAACSTICVGYL